MGRYPIADTVNKEEVNMNITGTFCLASILALSIAAPVRAQSPKLGDYYTFHPTTSQQVTPEQEQRIKQGDYYVAHVTPPSMRRLDAVRTCTDGIKFDSDRYVACMLKEGENP
jgi:hypothetical protein